MHKFIFQANEGMLNKPREQKPIRFTKEFIINLINQTKKDMDTQIYNNEELAKKESQ